MIRKTYVTESFFNKCVEFHHITLLRKDSTMYENSRKIINVVLKVHLQMILYLVM